MKPAVAPQLIHNDHISAFSIQVPVGKTYRVHFTCSIPLLIAVNTGSQPLAADFVDMDEKSLFRADLRSFYTRSLNGEGHAGVKHLQADMGSFTLIGKLPDDTLDRTLFFGIMADPDTLVRNYNQITEVEQQDIPSAVPRVQHHTVMVKTTILDCLYWNKIRRMWRNDGCWVSCPVEE